MSGKMISIDTTEDFDRYTASGTVLADFWAPWCGPCRHQLPVLEKIAEQFAGEVTVLKVNVEENSALAESFGVSSIPALFIFQDGKTAESFIGVQSEETLAASLHRVLNRKSEPEPV